MANRNLRGVSGKGWASLRLAAAIALSITALSPASAQEFSLLGGVMRSDDPAGNSYAWLFSYQQDLSEHLAVSFTWQNEGHVPDHHRDGHSVQIWGKTKLFSPNLELAAGIGPYRYYDTTVADNGGSYADDHGYGVLYSLTATWRTSGRLLYQARLDRVETRHSIDTTELIFGIGYKLDQDGQSIYKDFGAQRLAAKRDEVTLFAGGTIVNSFESENSFAKSIEYRHTFGPVLRGTIAWMNEGDARLIRRNGIITQAWLEPSFSGDKFTLGIGAGAYIAVDEYREGDHGAFASGVFTMTASLRFGREWVGRFSWNRILSNYDRDTDIIVFGAGYRF
jgi:hypothetical protein